MTVENIKDHQAHDLRIAICTPTMGTVEAWTAQCIINLVANFLESDCGEGVRSKTCRQFMVEGSMLPESRTALILEATRYEATHMLCIDGDMVFPWDSLQLLLKHGKHFVAVNYPRRKPPYMTTSYKTSNEDLTDCGEPGIVWTYPRNYYKHKGQLVSEQELKQRSIADESFDASDSVLVHKESKGLEKVTHCGFGLALIEMTVVYAIYDKFGSQYPFFKMPSRGYKFGGEDVHFCHSAIQAGFDVYVDHDLSKYVGHLGQIPCNHQLAIEAREEGVVPLSKPDHWTVGPKYDRLKAV